MFVMCVCNVCVTHVLCARVGGCGGVCAHVGVHCVVCLHACRVCVCVVCVA